MSSPLYLAETNNKKKLISQQNCPTWLYKRSSQHRVAQTPKTLGYGLFPWRLCCSFFCVCRICYVEDPQIIFTSKGYEVSMFSPGDIPKNIFLSLLQFHWRSNHKSIFHPITFFIKIYIFWFLWIWAGIIINWSPSTTLFRPPSLDLHSKTSVKLPS